MYTKQQLESKTTSELFGMGEEYNLDGYDYKREELITAILSRQDKELAFLEKHGAIAQAKAEAIAKQQPIAIVKNLKGYWALPCREWMIDSPEDVPYPLYTYVTIVHPDPA